MRIGIYIGSSVLESDARIHRLVEKLEAGGFSVYQVHDGDGIPEGTDILVSAGGDGTYLSAAKMVASEGIPVVGVNVGRIGFLSENRPEDVADALLSGDYRIENTTLLASDDGSLALNEMAVHRSGASILGIDVSIDGVLLPTYWADGIIVSTSSGSTAYSLSAGGPIVLPGAEVLVITPIAPHNLNVRPLIAPATSAISINMHSRDDKVIFTADNMTKAVDSDVRIDITVARFSLKRVRLNKSDFINALTEKLHWGEDLRNNR